MVSTAACATKGLAMGFQSSSELRHDTVCFSIGIILQSIWCSIFSGYEYFLVITSFPTLMIKARVTGYLACTALLLLQNH